MKPARQPTCHLALLTVVLVAVPALGDDDRPVRAYFLGNSVTDTIRYDSFAKLAASRGHTLTWGRHMIPGAPLSWLWEHPNDGFQQPPFGHYPQALGEHAWDVLSLQPFDRLLEGDDGDLAIAGKFIDLALKRGPEVQVYVYSRWPRRDKADDGTFSLNYREKWLRGPTGKWDGTQETRGHFEKLVMALRSRYEGRAKPALLVPVGDALLELDDRAKAGDVPGLKTVQDLYVDGIHFNNVGSYVVAVAYYATLFREDPRGLTAAPYNERLDPEKDKPVSDDLARAIQEAVWKVVSLHPLAGVLWDQTAPDDQTRSLHVDGRERSYLVHVPKGLDRSKPTPVVLALHGAAMSGPMMAAFCGLSEKADQAGFVVAYPSGTGTGPFLTWNAGGFTTPNGENKVDDVAFIAALLDDLAAVVHVDTKRVFACGMSNGGMMCYRLAAELADRIAAVAPVAGTITIDESKPARPVPVMHIHGTQDNLVPFEAGKGPSPGFLKMKGVEESVQTWVKLNGCEPAPTSRTISQAEDDLKVTSKTYAGGKDGSEVVLIVVEGGGHTWPGRQPPVPFLGKSTRKVAANDLIWDFFKKHAKH